MRAGLFPGQGIAARHILASLRAGPAVVERAETVLGYDLVRRVESSALGPRAVVPTSLAQPAILVAGLISFDAAIATGGLFGYLAGHSLGEYTALVASASIPFNHGLKLVAARGEAMQRAARSTGGGMASVLGLALDEVEELGRRFGVAVANDNSPAQVVVSGAEAALAELAAEVRGRGGRVVLLRVEAAFHSPVMEIVTPRLAAALDHTEVRNPKIPVVSNATARPFRAPGEIRKHLLDQLTNRVRFRETILWLHGRGVREFTDLGPGNVVGGLASETLEKSREVARA